jgi:hypothetical protein
MTISVYTGKTDKAKRERAIMLAMRNALPRSYYVCEEVDLPNRVAFAATINCVDLQIITIQTARAIMRERNATHRFQLDPFQISFPPDAKLECMDCIPSTATPVNDSSNPGGTA